MLIRLDHYNIETSELERTVAFYRDVLGMTVGDRPVGEVPGAWLCVGGMAVVHVNEVANAGRKLGGAIAHVAFEAQDFDGMVGLLDERAIRYECVDRRPAMLLRQVYVDDPNHIRVELNFPGV